MPCNILEMPQCIIDKLTDFLITIINAPLKPFLLLIQKLLSTPPNIEAFSNIWGVLVYVLSLFYGLLIVWAGINFIISGASVERRERAKEWLQNALLMIFFVQASYLLYSLITDLASALTIGTLSIIKPEFFLITLDNPATAALEIIMGLVYLLVLLLTVIILSINYFIASIGIIFLPFGIFFYFIPPLRDLGKLIISKLAFIIFLPFFIAIILLAASIFATTEPFTNSKIFLMIAAFTTIDLLLIIITILALLRAVMGLLRSDIARAIFFIKGNFLAGTASALSKEESIADSKERAFRERQRERERWGRVQQSQNKF